MFLYTFILTLLFSVAGGIQAMENTASEGKQEIQPTSTSEVTPVKEGKQEIEESPTKVPVEVVAVPTYMVQSNAVYRLPGRIKRWLEECVTRPYGTVSDVFQVIDQYFTLTKKDPIIQKIGAKLPHHRTIAFKTQLESLNATRNGKYIVVSNPGFLAVIDIDAQDTLFKITEQNSENVIPFALSPNNQYIAYGLRNGEICIRDLTTQTTRTLQAHSKPITSLAFNKTSTFLASGSTTLRIWDMATLRHRTVPSPEGTVVDIEFHTNDQFILIKVDPTPEQYRNNILLTPSEKPYHILWDRKNKTQIFNTKGFYTLALHPTQLCLAIGTQDGTIHVHNFERTTKNTYSIHHGTINALTFTKDGKKIISTAVDGHTVKIWDIEKNELYKKLKLEKTSKVKDVYITPSDIMALDDNSQIYIWNTEGNLTATLHPLPKKITEYDRSKLIYLPTSKFIYMIGGIIYILDCKEYFSFFKDILPKFTLDQRWFLSLVERKLLAKEESFALTPMYKKFAFKGKYLTTYQNI